MNIILFDDPSIRINLLPFTFTRPVAMVRTGILTIAEKWKIVLNDDVSFSTSPYLQEKYPVRFTDDNLWINGAVCPDDALVTKIRSLNTGEGVYKNNQIIALRTPEDEIPEVMPQSMTEYADAITLIDHVWKIFLSNGAEIRVDFKRLTAGRKSAAIGDPHTRSYNEGEIFLEEGVYVRAAILNAETGPIYLGKNSIVQEGAIIRGPFSLGEGGHVNMGGKMRGDVSIGPFSKVGGEVSTAVVFGNSNKAHDGFMGCAVMGEWCNLGADTNTSNLKNNYDTVKTWSYKTKTMVDSGLQFLGLMLGDHSKCGINTMFNTGTVAGVSSNIFGSGVPPNFIPSFSWGGWGGLDTFQFEKALETAAKAMGRRNVALTATDKEILAHVYSEETALRTVATKK